MQRNYCFDCTNFFDCFLKSAWKRNKSTNRKDRTLAPPQFRQSIPILAKSVSRFCQSEIYIMFYSIRKFVTNDYRKPLSYP